MLTRDELAAIAALCQRFDAWAVTDEIYEHIRYAGAHVPMATLPGMAERTVTISGASKTFASPAGGSAGPIAPAGGDGRDPEGARLPHGGRAGAAHGGGGDGARRAAGADFYGMLACEYRRAAQPAARARWSGRASAPTCPEGAYYILADYSALSDLPDTEFARWLTAEIGVTPVPGSSFFSTPDPARRLVRFAFCKREETLRQAAERLRNICNDQTRRQGFGRRPHASCSALVLLAFVAQYVSTKPDGPPAVPRPSAGGWRRTAGSRPSAARKRRRATSSTRHWPSACSPTPPSRCASPASAGFSDNVIARATVTVPGGDGTEQRTIRYFAMQRGVGDWTVTGEAKATGLVHQGLVMEIMANVDDGAASRGRAAAAPVRASPVAAQAPASIASAAWIAGCWVD